MRSPPKVTRRPPSSHASHHTADAQVLDSPLDRQHQRRLLPRARSEPRHRSLDESDPLSIDGIHVGSLGRAPIRDRVTVRASTRRGVRIRVDLGRCRARRRCNDSRRRSRPSTARHSSSAVKPGDGPPRAGTWSGSSSAQTSNPPLRRRELRDRPIQSVGADRQPWRRTLPGRAPATAERPNPVRPDPERPNPILRRFASHPTHSVARSTDTCGDDAQRSIGVGIGTS